MRVCASASVPVLLIALFLPPPAVAEPLTLVEAERLALEQAPALARARANVTAAAERAVAEGRLPDPQMILGLLNVPTDSYRLDREDMTMSMVGLRQSIPPGDTLARRSERAGQELAREEARLELERRNLLRQLRATWFELRFQQAALRALGSSQTLRRRQLEAAEGRYRAAQETQQELLRARQAVAQVAERIPMAEAQVRRLRAQLGRWIGEAAERAQPDAGPWPRLPDPPPFDAERHPEWRTADAERGAMRAEVAMARADYWPGIMLDLSYGFRRRAPDGMERPDMITAMVTFDLPLFRDKRQDRRLAERTARAAAAAHEAEDKRRELEAMHAAAQAEYEAALARARVFDEQLLPNLRREAEVTVAGFARERTELRDARLRLIEAELERERALTDAARARAELLYLSGEPQP